MNRREFILGSAAAFGAAGCRMSGWLAGAPRLRFGVISDIHLTTEASAKRFESALRHFRSLGADAVMVSGDLSDWGLESGFRLVKGAWDRVMAKTDTVPLFITGNHDYEGYDYGDMTMEMHANGFSEREAIVRAPGGMKAVWERIFHEEFEPVRVRSVKGYDFVSCEYGHERELADWLADNGRTLPSARPFFYFQHLPLRDTTPCSSNKEYDVSVVTALSAYPQCVAFTGHKHLPFVDERNIWQGAFTALSVPSLSYAGFPADEEHENGRGLRNGTSRQAMDIVSTRLDLRGGQGFFVTVFDDRIEVERLDLAEGGAEGAPAWVIPLDGTRPFDPVVRASASAAPEFPAGAEFTTETRNTENRSGKWTIVMNCEFPSAIAREGCRVFDYEISAVTKDGERALVKRFFSPAYAHLPAFEPRRQRFWFDVGELPQEKEYVLEVRARNCFGKVSGPLVSKKWYSEPGYGKVVR